MDCMFGVSSLRYAIVFSVFCQTIAIARQYLLSYMWLHPCKHDAALLHRFLIIFQDSPHYFELSTPFANSSQLVQKPYVFAELYS